MSNPLAAVQRATLKRHAADKAYRQAIQTARAAGHTLDEIAQAAGLKTRSGVHYLLHPDPRKDGKT